jgi:hypothetical protein
MRRTTILLVAVFVALGACTEQTFVKKDTGTEDAAIGDAADVPTEGTGPGDVDTVEAANDVEPDPDLDETEPAPDVETVEETDADTADPDDDADVPDTGDLLDTEPSPEEVPEVVEEALTETQDAETEIAEIEETEEVEVVTPPSVLDHVGWFGGAPPATTGPIEHVGSFGMSGGGLLP